MPSSPHPIAMRVPTPPRAAPAADPLATVQAWYATRDPGLLAEDISWRVLPTWPAGGDHQGRAAVLEGFFPSMLARFAEFAAEPEELIAVGEGRVVALGRYRGAGPAGTFESRFVHLWQVRDGRIARFEQVADTLAVARALGTAAALPITP